MTYKVLLLCGLAGTCFPSFALTISSTGACTSSIAGITATIDFGSAASPNTNDPGGNATYSTPLFNQGSDPGCGGSFLGLSTSQSTTITFASPVDYFGLAWGSHDGYNSVTLFDGTTVLGGRSYNGGDFGDLYANFFAGAGEHITSVALSSGSCCFETDNHSYRLESVATPEPQTFYPAGFAVPAVFTLRRYRTRRRRSL